MTRHIALFLVFTFLPFPALCFKSEVIHVSDGDTLTVLPPGEAPIKVRLYGIDAPEKRQPHGDRATAFTRTIMHQTVDVQDMGVDRYGRTLGIVILPGGDVLNAGLIRSGLAWVYTMYCHSEICAEWKNLESQSHSEGRGLWADPSPVPPWIWRKSK